jgi:hypothetical protein
MHLGIQGQQMQSPASINGSIRKDNSSYTPGMERCVAEKEAWAMTGNGRAV